MTVAIGLTTGASLVSGSSQFRRQFLFQQVFNERFDETLNTGGDFAPDDLLQILNYFEYNAVLWKPFGFHRVLPPFLGLRRLKGLTPFFNFPQFVLHHPIGRNVLLVTV